MHGFNSVYCQCRKMWFLPQFFVDRNRQKAPKLLKKQQKATIFNKLCQQKATFFKAAL